MVHSLFAFAKTRCKFGQCKEIQTQNLKTFGDALSCRVTGQTLFSQEIFVTSVGNLKLKVSPTVQMPFLENILSSTSSKYLIN